MSGADFPMGRTWLLIGRRETYAAGSGLHRMWLNCGGRARSLRLLGD